MEDVVVDHLTGANVRVVGQWDGRLSPIRNRIVRGTLLPTVPGLLVLPIFYNHPRRIVLEIHTPATAASTKQQQQQHQQQQQQQQQPGNNKGKGLLQMLAFQSNESKFSSSIGSDRLSDDDYIVVRMLKMAKKENNNNNDDGDDNDNDDDDSVLIHENDDDGDSNNNNNNNKINNNNNDNKKSIWIERHRYLLGNVKIHGVHGKLVELKIGGGMETITREIRFMNHDDALEFQQTIFWLQKLMQDRGKRKLHIYQIEQEQKLQQEEQKQKQKQKQQQQGVVQRKIQINDNNANTPPHTPPPPPSPLGTRPDDRIRLLIEIVSAKNLIKNKKTTTTTTRSTKTKQIITSTTSFFSQPDPFVIIRMSGKEIHRTGVIKNNTDPIWTLYNNSFCLLSCTPQEFFGAVGGLTFVVYNNDNNSTLGRVHVSTEELLNSNGSRIGYTISDEVTAIAMAKQQQQGSSGNNNNNNNSNNNPTIKRQQQEGNNTKTTTTTTTTIQQQQQQPGSTMTLYLRIKHAEPDDIEFMTHYELNCQQHFMKMIMTNGGTNTVVNKKKYQGFYNKETFLPPRHLTRPHVIQDKYVEHYDGTKEKVYRTKPTYDPSRRRDMTEFLTKEKINKEAYEKSAYWIEAGSGSVGQLYIEMIGCDDLKQKGISGIVSPINPFACLVFEDAVVNTDVIANTKSPRWMPWSNRAFKFHISHPTSKLYIGLFSHSNFHNPIEEAKWMNDGTFHDRLGRIMINLSKFIPGNVYTLYYPLYDDEQHDGDTFQPDTTLQRKRQGTVIIRLRFEYDNLRTALALTLQPPRQEYVALRRNVDFSVTSYTTSGKNDFHAWDMKTFTSHIEELERYTVIWDYVKVAALTIWLWRGHHPMKINGQTVLLPIHSMVAYGWSLLICWDFNHFFAFFFFSVGWLMLAINSEVRRNPSPWHKCASFNALLRVLLGGKAPSELYPAHFEEEKFNKFMSEYHAHEQERKLQKDLEAKCANEIRSELGRGEHDFLLEIGMNDVDISTDKDKDFAEKINVLGGVNPVRLILHPIQIRLGKLVLLTRKAKSVILWRENYYAFWITLFSMLFSAVSLWLPWAVIIRSILRLVLIGLLGPWMKIVDWLYFSEEEVELSQEEKKEIIRQRVKKRFGKAFERAEFRQIEKERVLKYQAMKSYLYGNWLVRVPHFNESYFGDYPLPESSSTLYNPQVHGEVEIVDRKFGQSIWGDMIPHREIHEDAVTNEIVPTTTQKIAHSAKDVATTRAQLFQMQSRDHALKLQQIFLEKARLSKKD